MSSRSSSGGFIADLILQRAPRHSKRRLRRFAVLAIPLAVVMLGVASLGVMVCDGRAVSSADQDTDFTQSARSYEFRVYELNVSYRVETNTGDLLKFDEGELPFAFDQIEFGDFRLDGDHCDAYFGGLSLVARAAGFACDLTFQEANGKLIQVIEYEGQPLIVLNSWEYTSYDSDGEVTDHRWGSMQTAAYDWRDGTWAPGDGILVNHSDSVAISSASLFLMVFEPSAATEIPEFGLVPGCVGAAAAIALMRRIRRRG